jgi:uncharacterized iron-regulated protein
MECGTFLASLSAALVLSTAAVGPGIYDGTTGQAVSLERAVAGVRPGQVVIISEEHDLPGHHQNQLAALQALKNLNLKISVGLEFLSYPDQPSVDRYVGGDMEESDFLQSVHWSGYPFDWYRPLVLFARGSGGQTRALNAPVKLAQALARKGLAGLSDEERSWLPPDFHLGNDLYFERFVAAVGQHGSMQEDAIRNFFAAQSAWDDTMAWQAHDYLEAHPEQVLVIIVGDFHASYGGGLPDRLRARGVANVLVISQVNGFGMSPEELQQALAPDARYGVRAGFVWLTDDEPPDSP